MQGFKEYLEWDTSYILVLNGFAELAFAIDALITFGSADIPRIIYEERLEPYSIYSVSRLAIILGKHSKNDRWISKRVLEHSVYLAAKTHIKCQLNSTWFHYGAYFVFHGSIINRSYLSCNSISCLDMECWSNPWNSLQRYRYHLPVSHTIFSQYNIRLFQTLVLPDALLSIYPSLLSL